MPAMQLEDSSIVQPLVSDGCKWCALGHGAGAPALGSATTLRVK